MIADNSQHRPDDYLPILNGKGSHAARHCDQRSSARRDSIHDQARKALYDSMRAHMSSDECLRWTQYIDVSRQQMTVTHCRKRMKRQNGVSGGQPGNGTRCCSLCYLKRLSLKCWRHASGVFDLVALLARIYIAPLLRCQSALATAQRCAVYLRNRSNMDRVYTLSVNTVRRGVPCLRSTRGTF